VKKNRLECLYLIFLFEHRPVLLSFVGELKLFGLHAAVNIPTQQQQQQQQQQTILILVKTE
jgi:hypothetical protein